MVKNWEAVMGKETVSTIQRGINKQTYSHLHPPQFFLLTQTWIREKYIYRGGQKGEVKRERRNFELKWDHSSCSKGNLWLHSTPYLQLPASEMTGKVKIKRLPIPFSVTERQMTYFCPTWSTEQSSQWWQLYETKKFILRENIQ